MDREDFSRGLYGRYQIAKRNGEAVDQGSCYFVLRIDDQAGDKKHAQACQ